MSIFEYDEEKELKLLRQAEYELGLEEGEKRGQNTILHTMYQKGFTVEQIAAFTDKSPEEVRTILEEM